MNPRFSTALTLASLAWPAAAQSTIDPVHKYAWTENLGFTNWADAASHVGSEAAVILPTYLRGFVWCENTGWIRLGATPADGVRYTNTLGADSGVNLDPDTGSLSGFAWGENIGWINFSGGARAQPPSPARYDFAASRLRGYAWSENAGWINLDDSTVFIGVLPPFCAADFNQDGGVDGGDVEAFFLAWENAQPLADVNQDGGIDGSDVESFFLVWESGGC